MNKISFYAVLFASLLNTGCGLNKTIKKADRAIEKGTNDLEEIKKETLETLESFREEVKKMGKSIENLENKGIEAFEKIKENTEEVKNPISEVVKEAENRKEHDE